MSFISLSCSLKPSASCIDDGGNGSGREGRRRLLILLLLLLLLMLLKLRLLLKTVLFTATLVAADFMFDSLSDANWHSLPSSENTCVETLGQLSQDSGRLNLRS